MRSQWGTSLDRQVQILPVGHLRLASRARRAATRFGTIGRLFEACEDPSTFLSWTPTVRREIEQVLDDLAKFVGEKGIAGWDDFRRSRPLPKDWQGHSAFYFMSPVLNSMSRAVRKHSVSTLHFSVRAINSLEAIGITTIGRLVDRAYIGVAQIAQAGEQTMAEIESALDALCAAMSPSGNIDWIRYARIRGYRIFPQENTRPSVRKFLEQIAAVVGAAVEYQYGARSRQVFEKRLLAKPKTRSSLKGLGAKYHFTGEWARIRQDEAMAMLRRAIWLRDYRGCAFRFRSEFFQPLRNLGAELRLEGLGVFSLGEWQRVFTHPSCRFTVHSSLLKQMEAVGSKRRDSVLFTTQWERSLYKAWGMHCGAIENERLLLGLLGFRLVNPEVSGESLTLTRSKRGPAIRECAKDIKRLLTTNYPQGLSRAELRSRLRAKLGKFAPSRAEFAQIIASVSEIEMTSRGFYRAPLRNLRRAVDKCERVLREQGRVLHYTEIVAAAGITSKHKFSISNMMSSDDRFVAVGSSGFWGLVEWNFETRRIADVAFDLLTRCGKPLTAQQLFDLISARRPCERRSIAGRLNGDRRFRRVGPSTWALTRRRSNIK